MSIPQIIISIPLFLVLAFGCGFILNMLAKTTWLPIVVYLGLAAYLYVDVGGYGWIDWTVLSAGLVGAFFSGYTIRLLRTKGYRMF